jgi:hypothetical protein
LSYRVPASVTAAPADTDILTIAIGRDWLMSDAMVVMMPARIDVNPSGRTPNSTALAAVNVPAAKVSTAVLPEQMS